MCGAAKKISMVWQKVGVVLQNSVVLLPGRQAPRRLHAACQSVICCRSTWMPNDPLPYILASRRADPHVRTIRRRAAEAVAILADEGLSPTRVHLVCRNAPTSASDTVLFSGFMLFALLLLVGGLSAPVWAMWKWHGGWRLAAAIPAAVMGFVVLRIIVGTSHDPTSHNLWPFEILSSGIVTLGMLATLVVARRFTAVPG